jgi:hypothetical protein
MNRKEAYALGYYYGRAEGSYGLIDLDEMEDTIRYEFKLGYDSGVSDYCLFEADKEVTQ